MTAPITAAAAPARRSAPGVTCPVCRVPPHPRTFTCPDCREDLAPLAFLRSRADRAYNLGLDLAKHGLGEQAVAALELALADDGSFVDALVVLGKVHAQLGNEAEARAAWQRALKAAPDHPSATAGLAHLDRLAT
ncbi:tetratricopeptide repeat protein [Yinghuangia soli]|uniref:Tetratricopeptide repeat protein n=1 Tax=Yinghuangia soli TaxID=2908204 RepID=A0AA41Q4X1_9ACTN|nr:tetratricopeptide repeat protein [Yinghuangia soli]MCF2531401.1 tetratricopeptide repeat protein [Yinghuangia soli]